MIIVGVLNTLEKPVGNFMGILPGDMKEKRVGPTQSQAHIFEVIEIVVSGGDSSSFTLSNEEL
jgi:hypothetical protein